MAALLLAGCTHAVKMPLVPVSLPALAAPPPPSRDEAIKRLQTETPCCHAWADLPFHDELPPQPREFTIDRFSPVAELDGERTHFLTFTLPKFSQPYRVAFQSRPSARQLGNSYLFAPTAVLLDANYKPLSRTDVKLCEYIGWRPGMSGAFGAVAIDDPDAHYLVVTSSKAQLAAKTYWSQSPASFTGSSLPSAVPASSGSFDLPHGPDGTLAVGVLTPRYADAVDNGLCGKPKRGSGLLPELKKTLLDR